MLTETYDLEHDLQRPLVHALEACGCWVLVNRVVRHRGHPTGLQAIRGGRLSAAPTPFAVVLGIAPRAPEDDAGRAIGGSDGAASIRIGKRPATGRRTRRVG